MHRTSLFRSLALLTFLGAGLLVSLGTLSSQEKPRTMTISVGETKRVELSNKDLISFAGSDRPKVAQVEGIKDVANAMIVTGVSPGVARITLMDAKKVTELIDVTVTTDVDALTEAGRAKLRKEFKDRVKTTFPQAKDVDALPTGKTTTIVGTAPDPKTIKAIGDLARAVFSDVVVSVNLPDSVRSEFEQLISHAVPGARVSVNVAGGNVMVAGTAESDNSVKVIEKAARNAFGNEVVVAVTIAPPDETPARVPQVQQIELEVIVAVVNRTEFRNMSFNWIENRNNYFVGSILGPTNGLGLAFANAIGAGIGGSNQAASANPNLQFGVVGDRGSFLGFLEALRTEGLAKIMSEPRIVAMAGRKTQNAATNAGTPGNGNVGNSQNNNANTINTAGTSTSNRPYILSGGETPVIIPSSPGSPPTVQYKQFGTRIEFEPVVLQNGKIQLDVAAELSNLNPANGITVQGISVPGFDSRKAETSVQIEPGQTLAIGGLIQNTITATSKKVPFLGDIPFLGVAFSATEHKEKEEEMIVLVTPRLVDPMNCTQLPRRLPGRETRPADDFELFLTQILEAPRGPREVCPDGHFRAAHMNGPTAGVFPCGDGSWGRGGCATGNCGTGRCGTTQPVTGAIGSGHVDITPIEPREALPVGTPADQPPMAGVPLPEAPLLPPVTENPLPPTGLGPGDGNR